MEIVEGLLRLVRITYIILLLLTMYQLMYNCVSATPITPEFRLLVSNTIAQFLLFYNIEKTQHDCAQQILYSVGFKEMHNCMSL